MTAVLDVLRYLLIAVSTLYATFLIWQWHWIAAVLALFPVYVILLNLFGFLLLPLYGFTPEVRSTRKQAKALSSQMFFLDEAHEYLRQLVRTREVSHDAKPQVSI